MASKVIILLASFVFLISDVRGQEEGSKTGVSCNDLCEKLTNRFKTNGIYNAEQAEAEIETICEEKALDSQSMCKRFSAHASTIATLSENSPKKKVCHNVCSKTPEMLNKTKLEMEMKKCLSCQQKVKTAARIANVIGVSLMRMVDIICPQLSSTNVRSRMFCKVIAKNIASSNDAVQNVAKRICSAMQYCEPVEIPSDQCVLNNNTRKGTAFEIALRIVQMIAKRFRSIHSPNVEKEFVIVDETAKCLPFQSKTAPRSTRISRRITSCQRLCKNITNSIERSKNMNTNSMLMEREKFKEFCYSFKDKTTARRCLVIYEAVDGGAILKTVFQKEVCEQLSCDLYETYPSWHCKLCKFNVQQQSIKTRIKNALKTLTDITKDVEELCKIRKDHKCENFLATQNQFLQKMNDVVKDNKLCNYMGLCKA